MSNRNLCDVVIAHVFNLSERKKRTQKQQQQKYNNSLFSFRLNTVQIRNLVRSRLHTRARTYRSIHTHTLATTKWRISQCQRAQRATMFYIVLVQCVWFDDKRHAHTSTPLIQYTVLAEKRYIHTSYSKNQMPQHTNILNAHNVLFMHTNTCTAFSERERGHQRTHTSTSPKYMWPIFVTLLSYSFSLVV